MLRTEMLAELQAIINDSPTASLWGEDRLMDYLSEGQEQFCLDTGYFTDFITFQIVTEVGAAAYTIDPRIVEIYGLYEAATNRWLGQINEQDRRPLGYNPKYPVQFSDTASDVSRWQVDRETGILTLDPTPTTVRTFTIRCWRFPLIALDNKSGGEYNTEPEIPAKFHRAPIEWAAYKAFMHHDMELQDPVKAGDHLASYRQYIRDGKRQFRRLTGHTVSVGFDQAYRV